MFRFQLLDRRRILTCSYQISQKKYFYNSSEVSHIPTMFALGVLFCFDIWIKMNTQYHNLLMHNLNMQP